LFCCDILPTRRNDDCLAESVYYDKHGVIVICGRKVGDKVHCYGLPDSQRYLVWLQWNACPRVYLGGLASSTTIDVVMDKLGHSGPPEFPRDNFISLPSSRMSCGDMVMVLLDNISSEVVIFWDIDMSAMKDKSIFKVPIF
jgi:hypothetical protein